MAPSPNLEKLTFATTKSRGSGDLVSALKGAPIGHSVSLSDWSSITLDLFVRIHWAMYLMFVHFSVFTLYFIIFPPKEGNKSI